MILKTVYERDLLYPTNSLLEPACIHVSMLGPTSEGKIPVIIECKTSHSPIENIDSIIRVIQVDIFDRIHIDIKKNVDFYFVTTDKIEYLANGKSYIKVIVKDDKMEYIGVDVI